MFFGSPNQTRGENYILIAFGCILDWIVNVLNIVKCFTRNRALLMLVIPEIVGGGNIIMVTGG